MALNNTNVLSHRSVGLQSGLAQLISLPQVSQGLNQVVNLLGSSQEALGRMCMQIPGCWQKPVPCDCRTEVPHFLADAQPGAALPSQEPFSSPCAWAPTSQSLVARQVVYMLGISFILLPFPLTLARESSGLLRARIIRLCPSGQSRISFLF